jgi:glycogen phosphorylase
MSNPVYTNLPSETLGSDSLAELALNLRWSWNHASDELWGQLDPELWELTQNPWVVLQAVSKEKLQLVSSKPAFRRRVEELLQEKREAEQAPRWFHQTYPDSQLHTVAYFSMEYMLSEALPIYSGGLGNVAGDQLKAANDLGVPVVAVGLLYQRGYFRQEFDSSGAQQALYPFNEPGQLPIRPLREPNGEWLRLPVTLSGIKLWIRTWQVQVGRTMLYLLDSNDPANAPAYRGITSELYGGGPDLRIRQEAMLGIGGWRLLRAIGLRPEVCHLNEGHAAFAVLERARWYMLDNNQPFEAALAVTRAGNLFTTHTPVEAGFDRFAPELMEKYFRHYAENRLRIPFHDLLALGRLNPNDASEPFNMAHLAMHGSGAVNGVSRLHGEVSRRIFQPLFPRWPQREVPVSHVTNGVHSPTWDSADADALWTEACGKRRWRGTMESMGSDLRRVGDVEFWQLRGKARRCLVHYIRKRLARQRASQGESAQQIEAASRVFDQNVLTFGFARRFATYKRPNLLLRDPDRLIRILNHPARPVQLVLAGKAHPQDAAGQDLIRQWNEFIRRPEVSSRVVFLSDYDMHMTERLVAGVDVWINTPRRPWEASGTSGMKVLVNGGLNLSELDGWWAEAYSPDVGWALGDGREHDSDSAWDNAEAEALYALLEREIVPEFYARDEQAIPKRWVARMRESMARLTPFFSANRTVREYTERHYLPAAAAYCSRAAAGGAFGDGLLKWRKMIDTQWGQIRFGAVKIETRNPDHIFEVQVFLNELDPDAVRVEVYADPVDGGEPFRQEMTRGEKLVGSARGYAYTAHVPAARPSGDYTARVVPFKAGVFVPLEAPEILWQR